MMGNYHVRFGATAWQKPAGDNTGKGALGRSDFQSYP
jgi:hypothetical protein